ncbi:MAG: hypothetical protein ACXWVK_08495, partial [Rhodoplanes sp.]
MVLRGIFGDGKKRNFNKINELSVKSDRLLDCRVFDLAPVYGMWMEQADRMPESQDEATAASDI